MRTFYVLNLFCQRFSAGQLKEIHIVKEDPPGKGYGQHALEDIEEFTWIPAYKNGRPVEMPTHLLFTFLPPNSHWKP